MSALVGCGQPTKRALRKALRGHWATMDHPTRDVPTWCLWSCPKASGHPAECRAPSRRAPSTSVTQIWQRVELQPRGGFFPQVPQGCLVHFFLQTWIHRTSDTSAPSARVQVHHLWHMELKRNWILLDWWRKEKNTIPFFDIVQSPKASKLFPHSPKLDKFRIPNLHSALRVTMMHQVGLRPNLPPRLVQLFFILLSMIPTYTNSRLSWPSFDSRNQFFMESASKIIFVTTHKEWTSLSYRRGELNQLWVLWSMCEWHSTTCNAQLSRSPDRYGCRSPHAWLESGESFKRKVSKHTVWWGTPQAQLLEPKQQKPPPWLNCRQKKGFTIWNTKTHFLWKVSWVCL